MFEEIDYILEGQNAERFAALYGCRPCKFFQLKRMAYLVFLFSGSVSARICPLCEVLVPLDVK